MKREIRIWMLALFGIGLAVSISGAEILAGILLLDWFYRLWRREVSWKKSWLDIPLLIFYVWALFTAAFRQSASFSDALGAWDGFLLFFLLAHAFREEREVGTLVKWYCAASVFSGFWGLVQASTHINYLPNERSLLTPAFFTGWPQWLLKQLAVWNLRAVGTRSHPLTFSEGLIPAFFLMAAQFMQSGNSSGRRRRWAWGVGSVLVAGGLIVSQARAVWLGVGAGFLLMLLLAPRKSFSRPVVFALLLAAILCVSGVPSLRGRLLSVFSSHSGTLGDQQSKQTRFEIWRQALESIRSHPVAGVGLKGARFIVRDQILNEDRVWTETHNIFLQTIVEMGLVGLGLLLWIFFICAKVAWSSTGLQRAFWCAILLAFMIAGFTESWTGDKEISMIFWSFVGISEFLRMRGTRDWDWARQEKDNIRGGE